MKNRMLATILAGAMIMSLAACGQPAATAPETEKAESAVIETVEEIETDSVAEDVSVDETVEADSTVEESTDAEAESTDDAEEAEEMDVTILPGGWQKAESPVITDELREIFDKAMEGLVGARYIPVAYIGTQLVSGRNYAIFCRTAPVIPDPVETYAVVYIYQDLDGNAEITEIRDFGVETGISEMDGAWRQAEDPTITEDLEEIFRKAVEGLLGVDYTPAALVATQVVNGTNYCFLCEAAVVYPGAETGYKLVYVWQDSEGNVTLGEIVDLAAEAVDA